MNIFNKTKFENRILLNEPLSTYSTLGIGGRADYFFTATTLEDLREILSLAKQNKIDVFVIGGGSNVVISDEGFRGLVVRYMGNKIFVQKLNDNESLLIADAGVIWDKAVKVATTHNLSGIECLSGVPGFVGAVPIQNIGAYGQEISGVVNKVYAIDIVSASEVCFTANECGFAYRTSNFKTKWKNKYIVTRIELLLRPYKVGSMFHEQVSAILSENLVVEPTLKDVRNIVLKLRKDKSMLINPKDSNSRSVGSFFLNPVVKKNVADLIFKRTIKLGILKDKIPHWNTENSTKFSAAWLIEKAGIKKGYTKGNVRISDHHVLAIVNNGGATAEEVINFAEEIQSRVIDVFGVKLEPEPIFVGFKNLKLQ